MARSPFALLGTLSLGLALAAALGNTLAQAPAPQAGPVSPAPAAPAPPQPPAPAGRQALIETLDKIMIKDLNFREADIKDIITFMVQASWTGEGDRINIILKPMPPTPLVTLHLRNASLMDALLYATEAAGLSFRVDSSAVVVFQPPAGTPAYTLRPVPFREARRKALIGKMNSIAVPDLSFRKAPVREILAFLAKASVEQDLISPAGERGVNILLFLPAQSADAPVHEGTVLTFAARPKTLWEAIRMVAEAADLQVRVDENAVVLTP